MKTIVTVLFLSVVFQASAIAQTEVRMAAGERRELNTFFSNFSETNLQNFK